MEGVDVEDVEDVDDVDDLEGATADSADEFDPDFEDAPIDALERVELQMHAGVPIRGWWRGEPIPDLAALPQERWRDVLRPLSPFTRKQASPGVRSIAEARVFSQIIGELSLEDGDRRARAQNAPPPAMPAGAMPANEASRQINFRLGPSEYERLVEVAKLFAMRPTTLARVLTVRGVERALYEERRDR